MKCNWCKKEFLENELIVLFDDKFMHDNNNEEDKDCLYQYLITKNGDALRYIDGVNAALKVKNEHINYLEVKLKRLKEDV